MRSLDHHRSLSHFLCFHYVTNANARDREFAMDNFYSNCVASFTVSCNTKSNLICTTIQILWQQIEYVANSLLAHSPIMITLAYLELIIPIFLLFSRMN